MNKKTVIALPLLLILVLPLSAYAESFTVTTNKDIYTLDEKAIIIGALPEGAPEGYAILIKVTGPGGDCVSQNILPAAENSFKSRPVTLDECGFGVFMVSAFYADLEATSTFTISNSSQSDAASRIEFRTLKNTILTAQDAVNARVRELIEGSYVLPEEIAGKYGEGVSETSLALQAIEFGDAAEAKKHMIFALRDFREVLIALSEENVARFEQTAEQQAANDDNSGVVGTYRIMREYYYRLEDLAQKNQVDKEDQFNAAARLLANARQMIDEGNFEGAERNLKRVSMLLEAIRVDLLNDEGEKQFVSYSNSTSPEDEESARKLADAADRFEKNVLELLNRTGSDAEAQTKVQEALSFIASARVSIEARDLDSARDTLTAAYWAIEEAENLIEDNDGEFRSNDGKNSDDSGESSSNSGKEGGDNDKGNKGSGNDGEDDQ